jgi:rod shape-determining protein MreD
VKALAVVLATAVAIALQTTLARFLIGGTVAVDLVLVVVVSAALMAGPVTGLLTGTFAGLIQDAMSTGVVGIGGLAKTVVGFAAGIVGTQFIVIQTLPRFVVFFGATVVHAVISIGLYELLGLAEFPSPYAAVAGQALANAIIGVVGLQLTELLPGAVERRRSSRGGIWR